MEHFPGSNSVGPLPASYKCNHLLWFLSFQLIVLLIIFVLRKRIKLVIQLFIEAGRAAQSMPLILVQPLWTFVALVVVCSMWVLGLLMVESAGHPQTDSITGFVYYKKGI